MKNKNIKALFYAIAVIAAQSLSIIYAGQNAAEEKIRAQDGVQSYNASHEPAVRAMAVKEMQTLATNITHKSGIESRHAEYELQVAPSLKHAPTLVYLSNGTCVGFLNYEIREPAWYAIFAHMARIQRIGSINFLVVDESFRFKGIGTKLIDTVLTEFRKENVEEIDIGTTKYSSSDSKYNVSLNEYYERFGFRVMQTPLRFYGPTRYRLSTTARPNLNRLQRFIRLLRLIS